MFETRITEMFGIKYPIIQGGLQGLADAELASAVSNAGGLGIINSAMHNTTQSMRDEIRKARSLTGNPIGININLFPTFRPVNIEDYIVTALDEGVMVFETSGRSPVEYMKLFKQAGAKVFHKVPGIRYAESVERLGVDAVAVVGYECGGHPGQDDVTSMILIPKAADTLKVPLIAAGGIADARGFIAAMAMGADAVLMGTRFVMTKECRAHPNVKKLILEKNETDTVIVMRSIKNAARAMRNKAAETILQMENRGATLEELRPLIGGEMAKKVLYDGEVDAGILDIGEVIGLIHDIPTVAELMERMVSEAQEICQRVAKLGQDKVAAGRARR